MTLTFVHPWVLLGVWLIPAMAALLVFVERRRRARWATFVSTAMQAKLAPARGMARFNAQLVCFTLAALLAIVAAARPQWGMREQRILQRGRDLVVALDVSRSMLATDVHPCRLERAKVDILDLIQELEGDRVALLAFRKHARLLCPLTTDYAFLRQAVDAADVGSAPRGETSLGDAILGALDAFEGESASHKAILLISDGEDLSGRALEAARKAGDIGVPIFTVGLGDRRGARIPSSTSGYDMFEGEEVLTRLDNETLYEIARLTGGAYLPVETASLSAMTLGTIYKDHLQKIQARELEETMERQAIERFQVFLLPAVLLVLAGMMMSRGRLSSSSRQSATGAHGKGATESSVEPAGLRDLTPPSTTTRAALALLSLLSAATVLSQTNVVPAPQPVGPRALPTAGKAPTVAQGPEASATGATNALVLQDGRAGARQAQAFFRSGDFEAAARAYRHAAATGTRNSYEDFAYNAALSYLRAGQPEEAAERFRDLTLSGDQADPALPTGLALALHANALEATASKQDAAGLLKEAGEGFKEALRRAPADPATRDSLATVLQQWPEAREKAHIETLMETHSQTPAPDLAAQMLKAQRDIATETAAALTNALPVRLEQMEALARRQRETADLWIPLKGKMMQAMAQEAQDEEARQRLAHFEGFVEATRNEMVDAADRLRDLDGSARELSETAGRNLYGMWKSIAPHAALLNEDILQQTNMMTATVSQSGPPEALAMAQQEARALTELFDERFQKEVPEEGLPAPPAAPGQTNAPAAPQLTAEDRAQIVALTAEAIAEQEQAMQALSASKSAAALANEKRAHELLLSIRDLLPKPPPQDQQQQPQESPPQQGEQPQEQPPENGEDPPPEPDGQQPPPEPEEQQGEAETADSPEDQEVEELLERALQREKEHEEDKRRRARALPPLPTGRDW